ncbi:MAG: hypothetical protein H7256_01360 [Bdellovibrio sp.]|nr:hypothetical protein [Bdellovibrio sp.]
MTTFFKTTILAFALIGLTNCSGGSVGSSTNTAAGTNSGQSNGGSGGSTDVVTPDPLAAVDLKGAVDSNDSNKNQIAFDFDKVRGEFIVMIPMPSGLAFSPTGSFAKYPDITFSQILDPSGKIKFGVRIPVKYIIKGSSFSAPSSLPNGNALPAMPAGQGELPSLALNFPQYNNTQITLYVGVNAIGLFMTLPDNIAFPIGFTLPIKNKDKTKTFGYLTYIAKKGTYAPGLFVSSIIPPAMARILEDYFHL